MPDDQNTTQNPTPTENSIPPSFQEPTEPAPENTAHSEPTNAPSEALESSPNDFSVKSNDIPLPDSTLLESGNEPKTEEKPRENKPIAEPISEPAEVPELQTAQMAGNEPLTPEPEIENEPIKSEPVSTSSLKPEIQSEPIPVIVPNKNKVLELLNKAKNAIQFRKRKKLYKIMILFLKQSKITNDEVEKFLHVSDATATRYLSQLEKEGKIKQVGKTGHAVSYTRI